MFHGMFIVVFPPVAMTRWRHPALAEFAISLEGFPESATDEQQILAFVRQSFGTSVGEVDRFFFAEK